MNFLIFCAILGAIWGVIAVTYTIIKTQHQMNREKRNH